MGVRWNGYTSLQNVAARKPWEIEREDQIQKLRACADEKKCDKIGMCKQPKISIFEKSLISNLGLLSVTVVNCWQTARYRNRHQNVLIVEFVEAKNIEETYANAMQIIQNWLFCMSLHCHRDITCVNFESFDDFRIRPCIVNGTFLYFWPRGTWLHYW